MPKAGKSTRTSRKSLTPLDDDISLLPEMVMVPEGQFLMGTSNEHVRILLRREDWAIEWFEKELFKTEQPQHRVTLPAYELGRYAVTNFEYHTFIWETGHRVPKEWIGFSYPEAESDYPVTGVSMLDALAYIQWLNHKTGLTFRLPSEAEWERAARGDEGRIYPWGNEFDPWRCNTVESGKRGVTEVGIYSPSGDSPYGAADMSGNVWEWTSSLLKPYPYKPDDGREVPEAPGNRVVRGGSWYYSRKLARCATREGAQPNFISPTLGFRLARSG